MTVAPVSPPLVGCAGRETTRVRSSSGGGALSVIDLLLPSERLQVKDNEWLPSFPAPQKQRLELRIPRQPGRQHPNPTLDSGVPQPQRSPRRRQRQRLDAHGSLPGRGNEQPPQHRIEPQRIQISIQPLQCSAATSASP
jgi:hypothetical protein